MSENRTRHLVMVDGASANATYTSDFQCSVAVVIGINDYRNGIPRLNTAVNDARRLAELLCHEHKYTVHLLAEEVTKTRLTDFLRTQLPGEIDQASRLLLYFAGHGIVLDSDDGPAGYLVPQDADTADIASFLPMTDLHAWLEALPCRHVLLILDCCFAGAIRWNNMRNLAIHPQQIYRERYQLFVRSSAWQAITSAAYDEKALDILKTGDIIGRRAVGIDAQHSPFALALFDALNGAGDTYPPGQNGQPAGDGLLTANELSQYLRDHVALKAQQVANHRQTPGLWPLKKHQAGEYVFQMPGRTLNLKPALPPATENNPYRGLKSYDEQDASLFFGRTQLIEQLAQQVAVQPLMLVLGASGTGKSSLVKAGLLPYLRRQADEPSSVRTWHILPPMRPGDQPLSTLVKLLCDELATGSTAVTGAQAEGGVDHADGARTALLRQSIAHWRDQQPEQRLLLVIDQFEELITLCREEAARQTFLAQLAELVHTYPDDLRLVITLRTDFEPQFADSALYKQQVTGARRFIVPPLSQAELREVIEKPAMLRVLYFDPPALVDRLIDEVVQTPGALPLLSFTLEQLYLKYVARYGAARNLGQTIDRAFTMADYDALGGVIGSLRTRADEEYNQLPDDAHRATMQRVMLRMVAVEGGEVARRRVMVAELSYPNDEENIRVKAVIARLVDARLVVSDRIDIDGDAISDAYIEPAHDALVRAWDRLRGWQVTAEHGLPLSLHRTLTQSATDWLRAPQHDKSGLLWNNSPWLAQLKNETLPALEGQFDALDYWLDPSLLLHQATQIRTKPTRFNLQETEFIVRSVQRRAFLWQRLVGITLAVMIAIISFAVIAEIQRREATIQREEANVQRNSALIAQQRAETEAQIALARELSMAAATNLSVDPERSLLLAIEALNRHQSQEVENALRQSLQASTVRVTLKGHQGPVLAVAYQPNGKLIATGGADATVRIWDAAQGSLQRILAGHQDGVHTLAFAADGNLLGSSDSHAFRVWDTTTGNELAAIENDAVPITQAAFSADGSLVVLATDCPEPIVPCPYRVPVRVWNVQTGQKISEFWGSGDPFVLSRDGNLIMIAEVADDQANYLMRVWNTYSGQAVAALPMKGSQNFVASADFGPDGNQLVTSGRWDASAQVWNVSKGMEAFDIGEEASGYINTVDISPNGEWIVTANYYDETARVWSAKTGRATLVIRGHDDVRQAKFSSDSRFIATLGSAPVIQIWDAASGGRLAQLAGHTQTITSFTFSPVEQRLATASVDGTVRIWEWPGRESGITIGHPRGAVYQVAFSPHQPWIATAGGDDTARVWNTQTGQEIATFKGHTDYVNSVDFSPNGSRVVSSSADGTARVWEAATGRESFVLTAPTDEPSAYVRHPIKGLAALTPPTAESQRTVAPRLPNKNIETTPAAGLRGAIAEGFTIAKFSPDGQFILTTGEVLVKVQVWEAATGQLISELKGHEYGVVYGIMDATFSADSQHVLTAAGDGTARLWDVITGKELVIFRGHQHQVTAAAFSPDGTLVVTASMDGTARVWAVETGAPITIFDAHQSKVWSATFTPDGQKIVSIGDDSIARVWEASTGRELMVMNEPDLGASEMQVSHDGKRLLTYSLAAHTMIVWDLETGRQRTWLQGHESVVQSPLILTSAAFAPDDQWVVSSGMDGTVRFYALAIDKLTGIAKSRTTRTLSCEERHTYLHETAPVDCIKTDGT